MEDSYGVTASAVAKGERLRLSPNASFYLQASITFLFLAGSSAPTALYPLYQRLWGFSPVTITIVFAVYALAVLAALLVVGRLSDHIGRRPVLLACALAQALAMLVLGTAEGVTGLVIGRILQGLAAGAAVAAVGAGLLDLNKVRGTVANAIAPIMGTATGGLVGGLIVHFLPAPTHLVYGVFGILFLLQCAGVSYMRESISPAPGALASLKPQFSVPKAARRAMLLAAPVLIAVWALGGFYASISPSLIRSTFGVDASLYGGVALFLLAGSGAAAVLLLRNRAARALMLIGTIALLCGVGIVLGAVATQVAAFFIIGTALAGIGFGAGFQGAIRSVVSLALPHERAGVLSVVFLVSYLAMGVPVVAAGFALAAGISLAAAAALVGVLLEKP